jgi:hypothetical protein
VAVIVDFTVPGATHEQMYTVEELTRTRGEAAGRPPYDGCMFMAVTAEGSGFRVVSAWRTEASFRTVLETMLGPDLASVGLAADEITTSPALSMAIPGAHGP